MTCTNPEIAQMLVEYSLGELDAPTRERIESHLESCSECRAKLEHIQWLSQQFKDSRFVTPGNHPSSLEIVNRVEHAERLTAERRDEIDKHVANCPQCRKEIETLSGLNLHLQNAEKESAAIPLPKDSPPKRKKPSFFLRPAVAYTIASAAVALLVFQTYRFLTQELSFGSAVEITSAPRNTNIKSNSPELIGTTSVLLTPELSSNSAIIAKSADTLKSKIIKRLYDDSTVHIMIVTPRPDTTRFMYLVQIRSDSGQLWTLDDDFKEFGVAIQNKVVSSLSIKSSGMRDGHYSLIVSAIEKTDSAHVEPVEFQFDLITVDKLD